MAKQRTYRGCTCGCGTGTWSNYAPGHDARHVARLVTEMTEAYGTTQTTVRWQQSINALPTPALKAKFRAAMSRRAEKLLATEIADMQDSGWIQASHLGHMVAYIDQECTRQGEAAMVRFAAAMGLSRGGVNRRNS